MGKQRTVHGPYASDDMGKDKVVEMDRERTRPKTVADGKSLADRLDWTPKRETLTPFPHDGLSAKIPKK
jgi:hypothetical protein